MRVILLVGLITVLVGAAVYMIVSPILLNWPNLWLLPNEINTLVGLRAYYTSVNQIVGILSSLAGLTLGYLYFQNRRSEEYRKAEAETRRKYTELLLVELRDYAEHVREVFRKLALGNDNVLRERDRIRQAMFSLHDQLSLFEEILVLSEDETLVVLRLTSFVDNNSMLMEALSGGMPLASLSDESEKFEEKYSSVKRICMKCLAARVVLSPTKA